MRQGWHLSEWKQKETNSLYFMLGHFYSSNHTIITNSLLEVYPSEMGSRHCNVIHKDIITSWQLYRKLRKLKLASEITEGTEVRQL